MTRWLPLFALVLATSTNAAEQSISVAIDHGRVAEAQRTLRVRQGDVVTLHWRADRPVTLHLHGYDIEWHVIPGSVAGSTFTAFASGRFPIETHGARGHDKTLLYLEVLPN